VENFALKVFGMADREDRSGNATRATAKKFMAAANFLEMLKVFGAAGVSEPVSACLTFLLLFVLK
jgi:vacuolar protein sorting-associated protein VTA1